MPASGLLWAEEISTCPKPQQKSKSVEALKRCDNDPHVIVAVARLFERDRKIPKVRLFARAFLCVLLCTLWVGPALMLSDPPTPPTLSHPPRHPPNPNLSAVHRRGSGSTAPWRSTPSWATAGRTSAPSS